MQSAAFSMQSLIHKQWNSFTTIQSERLAERPGPADFLPTMSRRYWGSSIVTDQFFTPNFVARRLVSFLRSDDETRIADFSAGDGELLRAAAEKWPEAKFIATDIDPACVSKLKRKHANWRVGRCDFLSEKSRASSKILRDTVGSASLVLLNPPFSCRGNKAEFVEFEENAFRCSTSMAFVLNSLKYLAPKGRLVAVLPLSSLSSQKDAPAWNFLRNEYSVRNVVGFGLRTFPGCAARTAVVRIQPRLSRHRKKAHARFPNVVEMKSSLIRGAIPMHRARNGLAGPDFSLVHTTDLRGKRLLKTEHSVRKISRYTIGPSLLVARVGQPSKKKCVLYLGRKRLILSDCVYAVRCASGDDARNLLNAIHANWDRFADLYAGTCAPYLTVSALHTALTQLGVQVTKIEAVGFKV